MNFGEYFILKSLFPYVIVGVIGLCVGIVYYLNNKNNPSITNKLITAVGISLFLTTILFSIGELKPLSLTDDDLKCYKKAGVNKPRVVHKMTSIIYDCERERTDAMYEEMIADLKEINIYFDSLNRKGQ